MPPSAKKLLTEPLLWLGAIVLCVPLLASGQLSNLGIFLRSGPSQGNVAKNLKASVDPESDSDRNRNRNQDCLIKRTFSRSESGIDHRAAPRGCGAKNNGHAKNESRQAETRSCCAKNGSRHLSITAAGPDKQT